MEGRWEGYAATHFISVSFGFYVIYRNMPWSVLGSVVLVTCCYFLVNVGYLAVLTPQELKESPATAVSVVQRVYGFQVAWIVPVLVACSIFGSANGSSFSSARVMLSAAREGHLPAVLAMIHTNKRTPIPALLLSTITACLFLIPKTSTVQSLMKVFSAAAWLTHTLTLIGLLWTRYKRPDLLRPFKLPIFIPVLFLFISLYLTITPFVDAPVETSIPLVFVFLGIPMYYFFIYFKATPRCIVICFEWISFKTQQILNVKFPGIFKEINE